MSSCHGVVTAHVQLDTDSPRAGGIATARSAFPAKKRLGCRRLAEAEVALRPSKMWLGLITEQVNGRISEGSREYEGKLGIVQYFVQIYISEHRSYTRDVQPKNRNTPSHPNANVVQICTAISLRPSLGTMRLIARKMLYVRCVGQCYIN